MSRHDDSVSLRQMLDHIEEAVALAEDRTRTALGSDRVFSLALLKLVEIVCEAALGFRKPCRQRTPKSHGERSSARAIA